MDNKMSMCSVLTNGSTIIYLIHDEQSWIEPCVIKIHSSMNHPGRVSFTPLQIFGTAHVMPPIDPAHILTTYAPEPEIDMSYRLFLEGYLRDTSAPLN